MADAIDQAAAAFDVDMGNTRVPQQRSSNNNDAPPEPLFPNLGNSEDDVAAGGDDIPDPAPKKRSRGREDEEDGIETVEDDEDGLEDPEDDDDDEDSADEEDDADDEDADDEDAELLAKEFEIVVDGEPQTVTLREALDGVMRTKTFHKRLNQLNEVKNELQNHANKIVADRQQYDTMLGEAQEILQGILPAEPDWDKLFEEDPKAARQLQTQYQGLKDKIAEIKSKRETHAADKAKKDLEDAREFAKREFPKFANYAKWRNQKEMDKDLNSMRKTATAVGFSPQEQAEVLDSRMLVILHKASKYDRIMASKPRPVNKQKKALNPGAGNRNGTAHRGIVKAQQQLSRTGSIEDAGRVFAKIIS